MRGGKKLQIIVVKEDGRENGEQLFLFILQNPLFPLEGLKLIHTIKIDGVSKKRSKP